MLEERPRLKSFFYLKRLKFSSSVYIILWYFFNALSLGEMLAKVLFVYLHLCRIFKVTFPIFLALALTLRCQEMVNPARQSPNL